ncbi:MAG: universal stress protein [Bacteroidia bacterium]
MSRSGPNFVRVVVPLALEGYEHSLLQYIRQLRTSPCPLKIQIIHYPNLLREAHKYLPQKNLLAEAQSLALRAEAELHAYAQELREDLPPHHVIEIYVEKYTVTSLGEQICDYVASQNAQLIVLVDKKRTPEQAQKIGSILKSIIRHTPTPTLILGSDYQGPLRRLLWLTPTSTPPDMARVIPLVHCLSWEVYLGFLCTPQHFISHTEAQTITAAYTEEAQKIDPHFVFADMQVYNTKNYFSGSLELAQQLWADGIILEQDFRESGGLFTKSESLIEYLLTHSQYPVLLLQNVKI